MLGFRATQSDEESEPDERWGAATRAAPAKRLTLPLGPSHAPGHPPEAAHGPRTPRLQRWPGERQPTRAELEARLREEGLVPWITRDDADTAYDRHAHDAAEVRVVVRGAMRFIIDGDEVVLGPGDRLDLPPGVPHQAQVADAEGVEYLCASRE